MGCSARHRALIEGRAGWLAVPLLGILRAGSWVYGAAIGMRNRWYDRHVAATVPVPVISVGNITVGGTGKTPMVIAVATCLQRLGGNPAVLSRGYRAGPSGPNDEELLIRKHCPSVAYLADEDRLAAAETALKRFAADCLILDDGFQHRRLGRQLDIVLIDATCPFGLGYMLPRGLLREPVPSLRRADLVVITRCDQVSRRQHGRIVAAIRTVNDGVPCLSARHAVTGVERFSGESAIDAVSGSRAVVFAAIANPNAFLTTVKMLGVEVVGMRWWPDHHRYTHGDLSRLLQPGRFAPNDFLLTTEKDAVKIAQLAGIDTEEMLVVKVGIDFEDQGDTILEEMLKRTLGRWATDGAKVQTDRSGQGHNLQRGAAAP